MEDFIKALIFILFMVFATTAKARERARQERRKKRRGGDLDATVRAGDRIEAWVERLRQEVGVVTPEDVAAADDTARWIEPEVAPDVASSPAPPVLPSRSDLLEEDDEEPDSSKPAGTFQSPTTDRALRSEGAAGKSRVRLRRSEIRRAVVLAEILAPPVGLRRP